MPWLRFTGNFDWKPKASVTLGYRVGDVCNVTRGCAEKALAAGKAVKLVKRGRQVEPIEVGHDR